MKLKTAKVQHMKGRKLRTKSSVMRYLASQAWISALLTVVTISGCVAQGESAGLERHLAVPGARVTLPVNAAKGNFSKAFIEGARQHFGNFHLQMGGDHTLYYNLNINEFQPVAIASPNERYLPLELNLQDSIGQIRQKTDQGEMTLDDYIDHPIFRLQGILLIHKGKIVYQKYPGMKPTDRHLWLSAAKASVGLVVAMLAEEGKINVDKPITDYVPQLAWTNWTQARVIDLLNHTTGLDADALVVPFFDTALASPAAGSGQAKSWIEVARQIRKIDAEKPGDLFRYSSMNTMALIQMIENLEGKPWARVFEERVWSQVGARGPMLFTLMADGSAAGFGLVSSTLEDFARFGMLFTPSWHKAAVKRVVSPQVLARIQTGGNPKSYIGSLKALTAPEVFNEDAQGQSYQFDYSFEGGALYKGGNMGQCLYIDPERDFVGVAFSTNPYIPPHGENKAPAFMRAAAKMLAGF